MIIPYKGIESSIHRIPSVGLLEGLEIPYKGIERVKPYSIE